jgi:hypothetical protein
MLQDKTIGDNFQNRTPIPQETIERIDKWDCNKLKSTSTAKETITRVEKDYTLVENLSDIHLMGLISQKYKELKK